jgi:hypothetical protein
MSNLHGLPLDLVIRSSKLSWVSNHAHPDYIYHAIANATVPSLNYLAESTKETVRIIAVISSALSILTSFVVFYFFFLLEKRYRHKYGSQLQLLTIL